MRGQRTFQSLFPITDIATMTEPLRRGRSADLIDKRNEFLIDRYCYYRLYHTDLNYEAVLRIMLDQVFIAEFTQAKLVVEYASEIKQLMNQQPSLGYFRSKWPEHKW